MLKRFPERQSVMEINDSILHKTEKLIFTLRKLYQSNGYSPYRMSKFEEYDLYAKNKEFLVSDNVITFNDATGALMALKPDVTLSIIKNTADAPDTIQRVYYNENVYRQDAGGSFKEIMQSGVECFGNLDEKALCDVILLSAKSLNALGGVSELAVSDLSFIGEAISRLGLSKELSARLISSIGERNTHEIVSVCKSNRIPDGECKMLCRLALAHSPIKTADVELCEIFEYYKDIESLGEFRSMLARLANSEVADMLTVDFSIIGDENYYNGVIFKGYIDKIPGAVISGGRYDKLMRKLGRKSSAVGFAVYLDKLDRPEEAMTPCQSDEMINIALPKGRLGEKIYDMFAKAGFECPSILEPNRKLIFENPEKGVRYFWVKPSDVAIYVERGSADIGVAGKDILTEYQPDVYELSDLEKGKCRMAVAAPKGFSDSGEAKLRVATKFANTAIRYYLSKGRDIDIIHLNGSIELAPILGLSDVIVDIVETGTTLRENNLEVYEEIFPISARLIANKTSFRFKKEQIEKITRGLDSIK